LHTLLDLGGGGLGGGRTHAAGVVGVARVVVLKMELYPLEELCCGASGRLVDIEDQPDARNLTCDRSAEPSAEGSRDHAQLARHVFNRRLFGAARDTE
jgi:hypothetical protein|tara:strand:+ start:2124 stop:2417 length:294 start_codon:yes stop_codon:yes gene_type:complete